MDLGFETSSPGSSSEVIFTARKGANYIKQLRTSSESCQFNQSACPGAQHRLQKACRSVHRFCQLWRFSAGIVVLFLLPVVTLYCNNTYDHKHCTSNSQSRVTAIVIVERVVVALGRATEAVLVLVSVILLVSYGIVCGNGNSHGSSKSISRTSVWNRKNNHVSNRT